MGVQLKLLSLMDNPATVLAAAVAGDADVIRSYLSRNPQDVSRSESVILLLDGGRGRGAGRFEITYRLEGRGENIFSVRLEIYFEISRFIYFCLELDGLLSEEEVCMLYKA